MSRRAFRLAVLALLAAHALMLAALARSEPSTTDERAYVHAGVTLRKELRWDDYTTRLHGPLPFLANQTFAFAADPGAFEGYLFWGRLGMVPFALVCALALVALARAAFGRAVALAALALHCLDPVVLANGYLMTCDMALAAGYLVTIYTAWRWLGAPSLGRVLWLGAALGMTLATKYLALFLVPVLGATLLVALARGFAPHLWLSRHANGLAARSVDALLATLLCAAAALLVLHACYLFAAPLWSPASTPPLSAGLRAAVQQPLVPQALHLLPEPLVRGIDFQKLQSEQSGLVHFWGMRGGDAPAYFLTALAVKLPLVMLLWIVAGLALRQPRWPRFLPFLCGAAMLLPLAYLSFYSTLKGGIRYILPVLPLLELIAARTVVLARVRLRALPVGKVLIAASALWLLCCHVLTWPRYISAFNALANERPYLLFTDSNLAWPAADLDHRDGDILKARHPDLVRLRHGSGPQLGKILAFGLDLAPPDPRDPRRVWHWLRRFHPVDRLGAFFVFDIDEASFRAAVGAGSSAPDPRSMTELAVALLGAGRSQAALAALQGVDDADVAKVRRAAELALAQPGARHTQDAAYASALLDIGRSDLVLALPEPIPDALRARALFAMDAYPGVIALLDTAAAHRALSVEEAVLLASAQYQSGDATSALATLERHVPRDSPAWAQVQILREKVLHPIPGDTR